MTGNSFDQPPELELSRLLVVCTGSAAASSVPQWLDWLRQAYPKLAVRVVVTRSAERFVTPPALTARVGEPVMSDVWPEGEGLARHVQLAEWAEAIVVYPATVHFLARMALGLADSPALLAAHCTNAPVVLAPSLPPGGMDSDVCKQHWAALAGRSNVKLVPPVLGWSLTTGREGAWVPPPLPEVLRLLAEHQAQLPARQAAARRPVPDGDTDVVDRYGTGLLHTTIHREPEGYRWRRAPGPEAPARFRSTAAVERAQLDRIGESGSARLSLGTACGEAGQSRWYRARGFESAAGRLLNHGPEAALAGPVRDLGRLLQAVHAHGGEGAELPARGAPGWARLGDWLAGRAARMPAAAAQGMVRRGLGETRWQQVINWYQDVTTDPEVSLAHGAPGLGSLVVSADSRASDLLTGEDVCVQPWYVDLGWVLGELVELKWQVGGDAQEWQRLTDALFEGYGCDLGERWNRMVALRVLLHVHDFAAYAGGPGDWLDQYVGFVTFLIDM